MLRAHGEDDLLRAGGDGNGRMRMPVTARVDRLSGAAAHEMWAELRGQLHAFVLRRVGDPTVADDLAQEIALRMHVNMDRLRRTDRVDAFAFQIARNLIVDHWRARQAHREEPLTEELAQWLAAPADNDDDLYSDELRREVAGCLEPMMRRIPDAHRRALELTDLGEHTQAEAAELLGLSVPGLKSRVQRGRAQVRELLSACCAIAQDTRGQVTGFERPRSCGCGSRDDAATCS